MPFDIDNLRSQIVSTAGSLGKGLGAIRRHKEKEKEEEAEVKTKMAGSELIGKYYGEDAASMYRLDIPASVYTDLNKGKKEDSLAERIRENTKQTTLAEDYVTATEPILKKFSKQFEDAMFKGEDSAKFAAKEKFTEQLEAYKKTVERMKSVAKDTERSSVVGVLNDFMTKAETLDPVNLETSYDVVVKELSKLSDTFGYIEKNKKLYNLDTNLSGMPTKKDFDKFAVVAYMNNELSQTDYKKIMNMENVKDLIEMSNDKNSTTAVRALAAAVAKVRVVAQTIDSDIMLLKNRKKTFSKDIQPKGGMFEFIEPKNYRKELLKEQGL